MCDVASSMRYCPDCRRAVAVAVDRASGDTVCALCGRVLGQRYVDRPPRGAPSSARSGASTAPATIPSPPGPPSHTPPRRRACQSESARRRRDARGGRLRSTDEDARRGRRRYFAGGGGGARQRRAARWGRCPTGRSPSLSTASTTWRRGWGLTAAVKDRARDVLRKVENAKVFTRAVVPEPAAGALRGLPPRGVPRRGHAADVQGGWRP
ncbi:hypothetical protein ZWY2020_027485 [Hordeum vulgare]|nr:hypothetical protein ZWY2020_027485 [Hordeum vulgare]